MLSHGGSIVTQRGGGDYIFERCNFGRYLAQTQHQQHNGVKTARVNGLGCFYRTTVTEDRPLDL